MPLFKWRQIQLLLKSPPSKKRESPHHAFSSVSYTHRLFEICKPCGLKDWIKIISEIWFPRHVHLARICRKWSLWQLFVRSKYLALVDRSFLRLCLVLLLRVCVLTLGNLAPIKGIRKDVRFPLFSRAENGCGNLGVISCGVCCMSCREKRQDPPWAQCTRKKTAPQDLGEPNKAVTETG